MGRKKGLIQTDGVINNDDADRQQPVYGVSGQDDGQGSHDHHHPHNVLVYYNLSVPLKPNPEANLVLEYLERGKNHVSSSVSKSLVDG